MAISWSILAKSGLACIKLNAASICFTTSSSASLPAPRPSSRITSERLIEPLPPAALSEAELPAALAALAAAGLASAAAGGAVLAGAGVSWNSSRAPARRSVLHHGPRAQSISLWAPPRTWRRRYARTVEDVIEVAVTNVVGHACSCSVGGAGAGWGARGSRPPTPLLMRRAPWPVSPRVCPRSLLGRRRAMAAAGVAWDDGVDRRRRRRPPHWRRVCVECERRFYSLSAHGAVETARRGPYDVIGQG